MVTVFTEGRHATEAILREKENSRANLRIGASQTILACSLLGMIAKGSEGGGAQTVSAVTAQAGNVGNGVPGTFTADAGAPAGRYWMRNVGKDANAGTFIVEKPDGSTDGTLTVAVAYNGSINGTIADGSTDFDEGDAFYVDVSYGDSATVGAAAGQFKAWSPTATDGSETAVAVALYSVTTAAGATADIACAVWDCDMNINCIVWPAGATDNQKAAARASLMAISTIYSRGGNPLTAGRIHLR